VLTNSCCCCNGNHSTGLIGGPLPPFHEGVVMLCEVDVEVDGGVERGRQVGDVGDGGNPIRPDHFCVSQLDK